MQFRQLFSPLGLAFALSLATKASAAASPALALDTCNLLVLEFGKSTSYIDDIPATNLVNDLVTVTCEKPNHIGIELEVQIVNINWAYLIYGTDGLSFENDADIQNLYDCGTSLVDTIVAWLNAMIAKEPDVPSDQHQHILELLTAIGPDAQEGYTLHGLLNRLSYYFNFDRSQTFEVEGNKVSAKTRETIAAFGGPSVTPKRAVMKRRARRVTLARV